MLDNMLRGTICIEDIEIGMVRSLRKTVPVYEPDRENYQLTKT